MWLRSEKRENRLRRTDTKPKTKLKCFRGPTATSNNPSNASPIGSTTFSVAANVAVAGPSKDCRNSSSSLSNRKNFSDKYVKCNKLKPKVKRLVNKLESPTRRRTTRCTTAAATAASAAATAAAASAHQDGKENCWLLPPLAAVNAASARCDVNDCNIAGQFYATLDIDNNTTKTLGEEKITSSSCSCARTGNLAGTFQQSADSTAALTKCISECDSTTDYEQTQQLCRTDLPNTSTPSVATITVPVPYCQAKASAHPVVSEVDSTTDLLPDNSDSLDAYAGAQSKTAKRVAGLAKLILPPVTYAAEAGHSSGINAYATVTDLSEREKSVASSSSSSSSSSVNGVEPVPATPDLISLFDEEMNKSTPDICPYSDFFPYNNILTQALLSCNETTGGGSNLCESGELVPAGVGPDPTFLAINQTAIDNLKALTNLQNHTTNFLAGISLPKPVSVSPDVMAAASFIHSATHVVAPSVDMSLPPPPLSLGGPSTMGGTQMADGTIMSPQNNEVQLETDECMEIEEIHDHRHEEMVWEAFDPYVFIKHLPPLTVEMRAKCPALPLKTRSSPEFSLVLDLDETLVHCSLQELSDASFKFPVLFQVSCCGAKDVGRRPQRKCFTNAAVIVVVAGL